MPGISFDVARRHEGDFEFSITHGRRLRCKWDGPIITRRLTNNGFAGRVIVVEGFTEGAAPGANFRIHVCAHPGHCQSPPSSLTVEPPRYHGVVTKLFGPDGPPSSSTGPACVAAAGPAVEAEAAASAAATEQKLHPEAEAAEGAAVNGEGDVEEAMPGPAGVAAAGLSVEEEAGSVICAFPIMSPTAGESRKR